MKKLTNFLFSFGLMAFILLVLCVALATATFIENDFGAEVARMKVYNTKWFELIFLLLSVNLVGRMFVQKLYKAKKFTIFLFHIAFVIMILGAAITRYIGYEGTMHIREGKSSSYITTTERVIELKVDGEKVESFDLPVDILRSRKFEETGVVNGKKLKLKLSKISQNAYEKAVATDNGKAVVGFILSGRSHRGFEYVQSGAVRELGELTFSFNSDAEADISFMIENDSLFIQSSSPIFTNKMGNQEEVHISDSKVPFEAGKLYKVKQHNLVFQEFLPSATFIAMESEVKNHMRGMSALNFSIDYGIDNGEIVLWEKNWNTEFASTSVGGSNIELYYGNKTVELPFSIYLNDFVIERYPGSMSPSSFSSYVTLHEDGYDPRPYHIYMNNILKHHGFRFFQSSYDQDERGTILSVNSDFWGTLVSYIGYGLLFLGMLLSMINKNSFFRKTRLNEKLGIIIFMLLIAGTANAQHSHRDMPASHQAIDKQHAEEFGELLIQNTKGRTEPVYTFASELIRKISRKESILGLNPVQLFMEMNIQPEHWTKAPIIRVSNMELQEMLGLKTNYASYSSFINPEQGYVLQQRVQMAYTKSPGERTKLDKAIIKTDEKINICYAIFTGQYLKMFPVPNAEDSITWYSASEAAKNATNSEDSVFLGQILGVYFNEVNRARATGDYSTANEFVSGIKRFQRTHAAYDLPSEFKTNVEIWYYKINPFKILFPFYATFGLIYIFLLITFVARSKNIPTIPKQGFYYISLLAFLVHTLALIARWYISGHAPMSNGYESMIFIAWVTLLAGFVFNKQTPFALSATLVLGGLTLMVANLSFMDPEITNLVPVLKSYWLTIHVSVITASYGFLGLGAILGLINLILIILSSTKNVNRIVNTIESLTVLNHKTLIVGLYLLTIGTFLGAVWANESWGRYWGWDPKETWALISMLVYTIITHLRFVPGFKGAFVFNLASLYGFGSILMTYFGVNYYLSGLHSYAAGDPVPIPTFVYYTVAVIILLTVASSYKFDKVIQKRN